MRLRPPTRFRTLHLVCLLFLAAGCTDEKIVYREPFNPPPDANSGFVGYFTTSDKSTTCGNCHVDHENKWVQTKHADAYATLVNSGNSKTTCEGCHTVSERGNQVTGPAGWNVVPDTAYHDVQCESCHGPGVDHIETPDANGDKPVAAIGRFGDLHNARDGAECGTHVTAAYLVTAFDQDDAELFIAFHHAPGHQAVAGLENMQRQRRVRK